MSDLFRTEAVEHSTAPKYGGVKLVSPPGRTLYVALLLAFFVSALAYLFVGSYTRRVTVNGEITTASGLVNIRSDRAATVSKVLVKQGQHVRKGEKLVVLANSEYMAGTGNVSERVREQIASQQRLLASQIQTAEQTFVIRAKDLHESITSLENQRERTQQQLAIVNQQIDLLAARQARYEDLLQRQYLTKLQVDQNRADLLAARLQAKNLQVQDAEIQAQLSTQRNSLLALPLEERTQLDQLRAQIAQVSQQEIRAQFDDAWDSRSPIDGIVASMPIKAGQMMLPQEVIATVIPADARMEADIRISDAAAGLVEPGQPVLLRLTAYPYQKFGQLPGRVVSVDRSPLALARDSTSTADRAAPSYRAVAALTRQSIESSTGSHPLLPGMTFEADLLLERRRLIEWVIAPAVGFKRRTFDTGSGE